MENLQLIYAGTRLVASTNGVLVFKANKNWTSITGVRVSVFSPNTFSDTEFNLKKNGENLFTDELTVPVGEKEIDLTGLGFEVLESDEFRLDLTSTLGRVYAPIILELTVETSGSGGAGASQLNELSDVVITSPAEGDVFIFDGENWINGTAPGGGADELDELSDVEIIDPELGEVLTFDGTTWVNAPAPSGGAAYNGGRPDNATLSNFYFREDFIGGSAAANQAARFNLTGSTTPVYIPGEDNHPGIVRLINNTSSIIAVNMHPTNSGMFQIGGGSNFEINWIFRSNSVDSNTLIRAGMSNNPGTAPHSHGIYIEKLAADTQFYAVARASATETRTAIMTPSADTWYKARIRRIDAATIGFSINDGSEITITTNIPTAILTPMAYITSLSGTKNLDVDYFDLSLTGLSRY